MSIGPHPQSQSDQKARLLMSNGELLRGIMPAHAGFYDTLLRSPVFERLVSVGLIRTQRAAASVDGYPLVVSHPRIDFVSDWTEWPSLMLRDAAVLVCDLSLELMPHGYGILDVHQWNILFDYTRPVFVDLGAIIPLRKAWLREMAGRFRNYYVLPLTFIAMGHPSFARTIRRAPDVTEPIDDLLKHRALRWFPGWYFWLERLAENRPEIFFRRLRSKLQALRVATARDGADWWTEPEVDDAREQAVGRLLEQLCPTTVFDIGCGRGRRALLAARLGSRVVACDVLEDRLNALYLQARRENLRILPLLLDFSIPTPRHGRKNEFPASTERLACDVSLLLGQMPRLVGDLGLSFDRIAALLAAYTKRYCVVEFTDNDTPRAAAGLRPHPQGGRAEHFVGAMAAGFELESVVDLRFASRLYLFRRRAQP